MKVPATRISSLLFVLFRLKYPVRMYSLKQRFSHFSVHMHHLGFLLNDRFRCISSGVEPELLSAGDAEAASSWTTFWVARLQHLVLLPPGPSPWVHFSTFRAAALVSLSVWHLLGNVAPLQSPQPAASSFGLLNSVHVHFLDLGSHSVQRGLTVWGCVTVTWLSEKKRKAIERRVRSMRESGFGETGEKQ